MSDEKYSGVVVLNKPYGITSHDAVNKLRRIFKTKKVGHTGTLDPMATGVLPILVGNAVKASSFLVTDSKSYRAGMLLGIKTDTEDTSGKIIEENEVLVSDAEVSAAVSSFKGEGRQIPPMYSALKVNGQKLYDLARQGITVEREARDIYIDNIEIVRKISEREWEIEVDCSKGTYIRTLVSDIGNKLSCGASMSSLCRTRSGSFDIQCSYTLEQLEQLSKEDKLDNVLIPTEKLFDEFCRIELPPFYSRLAKNGQPIYETRAKLSLPELNTRVRLADENGVFFALGEVMELDGEKCVKAIKMFSF
jgi:tRNA pseudouridine55 synthase